MKTISRYIMTLALLLTAVTGAWATDPNTVEWKGNEATWKGWTDSETTHTVGDITITCSGNAKAYEHTFYSGRPLVMVAGNNDAITFTSNGAPFTSIKIRMYGDTDPGLAGWTWDNGHNIEWSGTPSTSVTLNDCDFAADMITFTFAPAGPEVAWDAATKTGTFEMPAYDVEIDPIYAPTAEFATDGEPTAIEGIIAGEAKDIVKAGTVATTKIGEADPIAQGTVMYAVTTENKKPTSTTGFSATVPTAKDVADDGATLYVWYYIKGQDTPDGQQATEENTFNDTEICTTPLTVQVLTNKFDLTLKAANANTIEAGKATVTVGGTDKTVTDGKLQGVKMGSEVKVKANTGYKFRKVEVKKGGGEPVLLTTITAADNSSFKSGSQTFGDVATVTLTGNYLRNDGSHGGWYCQGSNLTATISVAEANGANITSVKFYTAGGGSAEDKEAPFEVTTTSMSSSDITTYLNGNAIGSYGVSKIEVYGTK